jgi:hypothetical protein
VSSEVSQFLFFTEEAPGLAVAPGSLVGMEFDAFTMVLRQSMEAATFLADYDTFALGAAVVVVSQPPATGALDRWPSGLVLSDCRKTAEQGRRGALQASVA